MRKKTEILDAFADRHELDGYRSFFLVGIGGAGMSGLAKMLRHRGLDVAGSDSTASVVTAELEAEGIRVRIGHSSEDIRPDQAVVLSDAIDLNASPEVERARELGCRLFRRSQLLGWLLKGKKVIAITGTHGKTTTTGMVGAALRAAGMDPLIVVGAHVPDFGSPIVEGSGEWAVVEACEAYDSYQDIDPQMVVLTNLELDHVDFHGSYESLLESVVRFVKRLPEDGTLIYCGSDSGANDVAARFDGRKRSYDLGDLGWSDDERGQLMRLPGRHNLLNAAGAYVASTLAGADSEAALGQGIARFGGADRRLQVKREGPIMVVDDYAHHPSEIEASLGALRDRYPDRRLIVVYQPHLYSRTAELIPEFAHALSAADEVVLTDIYPAREAPVPGVSSSRIAERIKKPVHYVPQRHLLPLKVSRMVKPGDLVVGMGAGNIADFIPAFLSELDRGAPTRVAVIYGGDSAEREVSLHSGWAVHRALLEKGYAATLLDVSEVLLSRGDLTQLVGPQRPDVAFLAVHGTNAEDGAIQGLLELLHIPYTGSGIQSSALAMDKQLTKQLLAARGLPVPKGILLSRAGDAGDVLGRMKAPLIVKPNAQGSTVGLSFVRNEQELPAAIQRAFQYDDQILVEEMIEGMEISVPVLGDRALPVVEIRPNGGEYDFAAKYLPGATEEIVPAPLSRELTEKAQRYAIQAHQALKCEGATRTDMIVRGDEIYILEVNTLPGMTGTSLLPNSARAAGMSFGELVDWMVQDALRRYAAQT
jgi:UDP-N-acetylmuramate--L-alanine ligase